MLQVLALAQPAGKQMPTVLAWQSKQSRCSDPVPSLAPLLGLLVWPPTATVRWTKCQMQRLYHCIFAIVTKQYPHAMNLVGIPEPKTYTAGHLTRWRG
jgi:hypothetical protein